MYAIFIQFACNLGKRLPAFSLSSLIQLFCTTVLMHVSSKAFKFQCFHTRYLLLDAHHAFVCFYSIRLFSFIPVLLQSYYFLFGSNMLVKSTSMSSVGVAEWETTTRRRQELRPSSRRVTWSTAVFPDVFLEGGELPATLLLQLLQEPGLAQWWRRRWWVLTMNCYAITAGVVLHCGHVWCISTVDIPCLVIFCIFEVVLPS